MYKINIILIGTTSCGGTSEVVLPCSSLRNLNLDDDHDVCVCM